MDEHRVIEQVLACLEKMAEKCAVSGELDQTAARQATDFFQNFADQCHHRKEENHLFPMLEMKGFSRKLGPTGVMMHEHSQGRAHLQVLGAAVEDSARGNPESVQKFVNAARAYVQLLRAHIAKENLCLFPMADEALTDDEQRNVAASFSEVESHNLRPGTHEKYLRLADALADHFDVPHLRGETASSCKPCSCNHTDAFSPA
jgi:hemerythrin-like domain-containing protein